MNINEIKVNLNQEFLNDKQPITIKINARGIKYEILSKSLDKHPNTRLGKLKKHITNNNQHEISLLCDDYNLNLNEFYFNRDPFVLNMILNYYQTNKLHVSHTECVLFLRDELDYWQIDEDSFHSCCQVVYHDKLENSDEIFKLEKVAFKNFLHKDDYGEYCFPGLREKIWNLFDNPNSTIYAKLLFYFSISAIFVSTLLLVVKTIPEINYEDDSNQWNASNPKPTYLKNIEIAFTTIDISCVVWFLVEFLVRIIVCPNKIKFLKSPLNLIDLASSLPYMILFILPGNISSSSKNIIRMLRVLLLLKITRFSVSLRSFGQTLMDSSRELGILIVYLVIGVVFFSSIVFYFEKDYNQSYSSIPAAFWWGIATMTTVGYGDITPITIGGKIFGGICAATGLLILAMPIGIISSNFSKTIMSKKREKYLLKSKLFKI